jgi:hypothetical protein
VGWGGGGKRLDEGAEWHKKEGNGKALVVGGGGGGKR